MHPVRSESSERLRSKQEERFRARQAEKAQRLRSERERRDARDTLAAETRLDDEPLLDALLDLGVRAESLSAFFLAPLVAVAWADGRVDERERERVLAAARHEGLDPSRPAHQLLERWLDEAPDDRFLPTWQRFVAASVRRGGRGVLADVEAKLAGRLREVAVASRGTLGIGRISREEAATLSRVAVALMDSGRA